MTVSAGRLLPPNSAVVLAVVGDIRLSQNLGREERAHNCAVHGLHVQSRSYWAPANIGPYSQAKTQDLPFAYSTADLEDLGWVDAPQCFLTYMAGQIPLLPHSMSLPKHDDLKAFLPDLGNMDHSEGLSVLGKYSTILSLQHLWRVGRATKVNLFTAGFAYLARSVSQPSRW